MIGLLNKIPVEYIMLDPLSAQRTFYCCSGLKTHETAINSLHPVISVIFGC